MLEVPEFIDDPIVNTRMMPPMTWNGTLVGPAETATHYLHLTAFPCQKCNGPVIAGSLGTRHDVITQEPEIRDHGFRPIEWRWAIKPVVQL